MFYAVKDRGAGLFACNGADLFCLTDRKLLYKGLKVAGYDLAVFGAAIYRSSEYFHFFSLLLRDVQHALGEDAVEFADVIGHKHPPVGAGGIGAVGNALPVCKAACAVEVKFI